MASGVSIVLILLIAGGVVGALLIAAVSIALLSGRKRDSE